MNDFQLRPYRIAAELDTMFNDKHLTGIGTLQFLGANQLLLNDDFGGLSSQQISCLENGDCIKGNLVVNNERQGFNCR